MYDWMSREGLILIKDRHLGDHLPLAHDPIGACMHRLACRCFLVLLMAASLAGCDKCGDPVKLNAPWDSKSCHSEATEAR